VVPGGALPLGGALGAGLSLPPPPQAARARAVTHAASIVRARSISLIRNS